MKYKLNQIGPSKPSNAVGKYKLNVSEDKVQLFFNTEVNRLVDEGELVPWEGVGIGLLRLMD